MFRVEYADQVSDDFDRIVAHLLGHAVDDIAGRLADIQSAIGLLERNPDIGRPVDAGLRELVIGRGSRGYVALYAVLNDEELVLVLALRSQSEAGYRC